MPRPQIGEWGEAEHEAKIDREHYEAQGEYADMLFEALEIPDINFIRKYKAFRSARIFKDSHRKCCEWANEEI